MLDNLKNKYLALDRRQKLRILWSLIGVVLFIILYLAYETRTVEIAQNTVKQDSEKTTTVVTNAELFEDDVIDMVNDKAEKLQGDLEKLKQENSNLKKMFEVEMQQSFSNQQQNNNTNNPATGFPPSPATDTNYVNGDSNQTNLDLQPQWVGGIIHEEYDLLKPAINTKNNAEKKE